MPSNTTTGIRATRLPRAAVGVIVRDERLLTICRSATVLAPGQICFPGGGIHQGETEPEAVVRELREEPSVTVEPIRRLWRSITPWGISVAWWLISLNDTETLLASKDEVESFHWRKIDEIRALPNLLQSNRQFLAALDSGEFDLADNY